MRKLKRSPRLCHCQNYRLSHLKNQHLSFGTCESRESTMDIRNNNTYDTIFVIKAYINRIDYVACTEFVQKAK